MEHGATFTEQEHYSMILYWLMDFGTDKANEANDNALAFGMIDKETHDKFDNIIFFCGYIDYYDDETGTQVSATVKEMMNEKIKETFDYSLTHYEEQMERFN